MVLTESQKEIQRKRKISAAVTQEQKDKGTQKRAEKEKAEVAQSRAKRTGKIAVKTPEGFEERTREEFQALQAQKQLAANKQIISETPEGRAQTEREEAAKKLFAEKGFAEQTLAEKQQLDPERDVGRAKISKEGLPSLGEDLPLLGGSRAAINAAFKDLNVDDTLIQDPETAREIALQEIQKKVIAEGLSSGEKFGTLIEAIPIVGTLAQKYASGLIEDPKSNVNTVLAEIDSERERASVLAEKAMTGKLGDPFIAVQQIEDIEDNMARLEQRMKLLADSSPQLRVDADQLNRIEEKILRSKERIFIAKQAAAAGVVAPATDSNIFLTLQALNEQTK